MRILETSLPNVIRKEIKEAAGFRAWEYLQSVNPLGLTFVSQLFCGETPIVSYRYKSGLGISSTRTGVPLWRAWILAADTRSAT